MSGKESARDKRARERAEREAAAAAASNGEGKDTSEKNQKPAEEKPKRKTTARKAPKEKAATPPSPAPVAAAAAAAAPVEGDGGDAVATKEGVMALLLPRLRDANPDVSEEELRGVLDATIDSYEPQNFDAMMLLEDIQEDLLGRAQAVLAPEAAPEAAPPAGSAAAAAAAAAAEAEAARQAAEAEAAAAAAAAEAARQEAAAAASPAASVDSLLSAAKAAQKRRAASIENEEEEDSPPPSRASSAAAAAAAASGKSPQEVMSIKVPITGQAVQYTIEVKANSPGAAPMDFSQASASQGTIEEEAAPAPGIIDATTHTVRWYPVTDAAFPEKLGERMNLIFPAHKMAPVSWSDMKQANRTNGETYYAFTVSETPPGYDSGEDFTLMRGDPKKVVAAGVINGHSHSLSPGAPPTLTVVILDMGTREDVQPKGVNPYLTLALKSLATQMRGFGEVVVRHSRKQLFSDSEYQSVKETLFANGIGLSGATAGGPTGQEALFKIPGETEPVAGLLTGTKLNLSVTGPKRLVYTYRDETTGAEKSFPATAIERVYVAGRRGTTISPMVEFIGYLSSVLTPVGEGEKDVTVPNPIIQDGFRRVEPRRGGRKTTSRRRSSSPRRKVPSSGRRSGYTRRRRA